MGAQVSEVRTLGFSRDAPFVKSYFIASPKHTAVCPEGLDKMGAVKNKVLFSDKRAVDSGFKPTGFE
jgi:hypothetical protein